MQEKSLQNLVINKVESQEVYDSLSANGAINSDELYLVGGDSSVDSVNGQTGDVNLDIPVVHKIESQDAYDEMVTAGQINAGELYLVQGDEYVQYTEQSLTDEQKAQARENIGAQDIQVANAYFLWDSNHNNDIYSIYNNGARIGIITGEGMGDSDGNIVYTPLMIVFGSVSRGYVSAVATSAEGKMYSLTLNLMSGTKPTLHKIKNIMLNDDNTLSQQTMEAAPTTDMQIATKKYVDDKVSDKELILASSTENSTKKFKITVDDSGTISATEVN